MGTTAPTVRDDAGVEDSVIREYEATRRDLVQRGLTAAGTALAASSIPLLLFVRNAFAQSDDDAAILKAAIGLEEVAVFSYAFALRSRLLQPQIAQLVRLFHQHEEAHRDGLTAALGRLGGTPPLPPRTPRDSPLLAPLARLRTQQDVLRYSLELETMAVAAYYDAQSKLKGAQLLSTGAQIMANEGQHLVVLRAALRLAPVPNAFETGKATS
jgi:rubrerythrin